MELQKLLQTVNVFRFHNRKTSEDENKFAYLNELQAASPVKLLNLNPNTEIAEIPYGLGKSEKFSNKLQVENVLKALKCVDEFGEFVDFPKKIVKSVGKIRVIPTSVEHHYFKKNLSPYSPGVVRINSKGLDNAKSLMAETRKTERFLTPQPKNFTSSKLTMSFSPDKTGSYMGSPNKPQRTNGKIMLTTKVSFLNSIDQPKTPQIRSAMLKKPEIKDFNYGSSREMKDGYGEIMYPNGDFYKGNFKKNLKEGTGKYYYSKFSVKYKGEFKEDLRMGSGFLIFSSGDVYHGNWNKGFIENGAISIKYKDKSEYSGESKQGKRHGSGKMEYQNQGTYEGHWENDQRSGYGVIHYHSEVFFEGTFSGDYTDGPGVLVRKDIFNLDHKEKKSFYHASSGCIEKSDFFKEISNFPHFKTISLESTDLVFMSLTSSFLSSQLNYYFPNGKFVSGKLTGGGMVKYGTFGLYYGGFSDGKRSGHGKMIYTDPDHCCNWFPETEAVYIGDWRNDKRHGLGKLNWNNGAKYEGKFNNDRRHNVIGKISFANGETYEGGWVEDLMQGACTIKRKGITIRGQCIKGVLASLVRVDYEDGRAFEGNLSNNLPNGSGRMTWPNESMYEGEFFEGSIQGMGRMTYPNGDYYQGQWENGKRNGEGVMYYTSSKLKYQGDWVDGKRSGEGILTNSKGEIISKGLWSNDEIQS